MTSGASAARSQFGTVERDGGAHVMRYERRLVHPVEKVWAALTVPEQLAEWLAAADELELRHGGRIVLRYQNVPDDLGDWKREGVEMPEDLDPGAAMSGTITRLDPPRLIEYELEQMGLMRWELRPDGDGCLLTFTNVVELPVEVPPEQTLAGWHVILDTLAEALAGRPPAWETWTQDHMQRWKAIRDSYVERLRG